MVVYVKTGDKSAEWSIVYKVKSTVPGTEPCGTPYESVTLPLSLLIMISLCTFSTADPVE